MIEDVPRRWRRAGSRRGRSPLTSDDTDLDAVMRRVMDESRARLGQGRLPDYIPALASVEPGRFGMAITTVSGQCHVVGDGAVPFSIQSIAKLFTLILAMHLDGEMLWSRVGREPSGTRYNSMVQLEYEQGIPRNPLINAGALVTLDRIMVHKRRPLDVIEGYARFLSANPEVGPDENVCRSELACAHTNRAVAHLLKAFGTIETGAEDLVAAYCRICALSMSCLDLSIAFLPLAARGYSPVLRESILTPRHARRVNALMLTCGMYDAVGNFAFRVGLPAKSGVGGGIVAIVPDRMCIAVWSPELDLAGNSVVGTRALELFVEATQCSVF